jgi:hypothetical protein
MATAGLVFQVAVFDPAATHVMGEAFDCACRSLRGIGQVGSVREIIAKRIIEVARAGERHPDRLCDYALHGWTFLLSRRRRAPWRNSNASLVAGSLTAMFDMVTNLMLDTITDLIVVLLLVALIGRLLRVNYAALGSP